VASFTTPVTCLVWAKTDVPANSIQNTASHRTSNLPREVWEYV